MSFAKEVKQQLSRAEVKSAESAAYELYAMEQNKIIYTDRYNFLKKKAGSEYDAEKISGSLDLMDGENAKGFIRGCFLGGGTVNSPKKTPHLEIRFRDGTLAEHCREAMIMAGFSPNMSTRREYIIVYMKKSELIAGFLGYMGAFKAYLDFENEKVSKEVNSGINRAVNCDLANINKAGIAGREQCKKIEELKKSGRFINLSDDEKALAELRLENPEATLEDLGKMLSPKISKSGVAHRMKKITSFY